MNKISTPEENRNFVSKISDFFKILLAFPADMIPTGISIIPISQNSKNKPVPAVCSFERPAAKYNVMATPLYNK